MTRAHTCTHMVKLWLISKAITTVPTVGSLHTLVNCNRPHQLTIASYRLEKQLYNSLYQSKSTPATTRNF